MIFCISFKVLKPGFGIFKLKVCLKTPLEFGTWNFELNKMYGFIPFKL
jgi:hypothetical protein